MISPFGRFIRTGTESGEISDGPNNIDGEADDAFDFTAPVRSFLEKSRKQVQHYFSGTQDPVESSFAEKNSKKKGNAEGSTYHHTTGCFRISVKSETPLFCTHVGAADCPFTW